MVVLEFKVKATRKWWAMPALRGLYAFYWVVGRFLPQKQRDALADGCISLIAKKGMSVRLDPL